MEAIDFSLYSFEQLSNLNELQQNFVSVLKSLSEINEKISPLRERNNELQEEIEKSENRYNSIAKKGLSVSLEEATEMVEMIEKIKSSKDEKDKIVKEILEYGEQLSVLNAKKVEIMKEREELNNSVVNSLVPTKEPVSGKVKVKGSKVNTKNPTVNVNKCAIVSNKKSVIGFLSSFFKKNKNKTIEVPDDLATEMNNAGFIQTVKEMSNEIKQAREEAVKKMQDELKVKEIENECDEFEKEQGSVEAQELAENLNFYTKNPEIRLSTEAEMEERAAKTEIEENKNTTEKVQNIIGSIENEIKLSDERKINKNFEEKAQKIMTGVNNEIKAEEPSQEINIDLSSEPEIEIKTPVENKSDDKYIKPTLQFQYKDEGTPDSVIIDNMDKVIKHTINSALAEEQASIVENVNNNYEQIKNKASSKVSCNTKTNGICYSTVIKLKTRSMPQFAQNNPTLKHIIEVVGDKVISVKSEEELTKVKMDAYKAVAKNVESKAELLGAQHIINDLFDEAKNEMSKAM